MSTANCSIYGKCGGCLSGHEPDKAILEAKVESMKRLVANLEIAVENSEPQIFEGEHQKYRNKMDYALSQYGPALRMRKKFFHLLPIQICGIANESSNAVLEHIKDWFSENAVSSLTFDQISKEGVFRYSVIRSPENSTDTTVTFILNQNADENQQKKALDLIKIFADNTPIVNVLVGYVHNKTDVSSVPEPTIIKGDVYLTEKLSEISYKFHSQGFFQVNTKMAENMVEYVKNNIDTNSSRDIVDLFGGVGTFGIYSAAGLENKKVHVIDNNPVNIDCAQINCQANNIKSYNCVCLDAKELESYFETNNLAGECDIIADPPRVGFHKKTISFINSVKPNKLIYLSCNPSNIEQLNYLKDNYSVEKYAIFDMFPQTGHIEAIFVLKKKGSDH